MFGVQNIWPTLGEELGEDIEYVQNGNMRMGKTEKDLAALQEIVAANRELGLDIRLLTDIKDIRELLPMVADDVICATWCPTDGHANPMRTTLALYKKARALGAKFITNIKVLKLEKVAGSCGGSTPTTVCLRQTASSSAPVTARARSCAPWVWTFPCFRS